MIKIVSDFTDMPFGESDKVFSVTVKKRKSLKKIKSTEIISKELVTENY